MRLSACCGLVLAALLAGCATLEQAPRPAANNSIVRTYHQTVEINGRLSVRYQQGGTEEALHGNFSWQQAPAKTTITLTSPLGQTLATIELEPQRAILKQAGQPARVATDADELAADALGWPLPVAGLKDWLQGFAVDAQGKTWVANPDSAAELTTQDGWRIAYVNWQEQNGKTIPKRIDLSRQTRQAGPVAIRIVIDQWQTNS